ncbi:MAG: VOC family protein [Actinomycetia bacterium]|nr:VOC family protein [Actinomycetes bacterium]MCP4221979.1 VOC family protein [Actinomycetes bacterium]MCP5032811.1 VOC family protein [Actinomycetes bacterium]
MHITGMVHVNVNCSDFDVSLAFYQRLGFKLVAMVPETNTPEVAAAVGMPPYRVRGAILKLPGESTLLDLLQWQEPHDPSPPYQHLYHIGLARIALRTTQLDADVAELARLGIKPISEPAAVPWEGQPTSRIVCFHDPDGTVLELVELDGADSTKT